MLFTAIEKKLSGEKILRQTAVSGGSINRVYCLYTAQRKYLLKLNSKSAFPGMFRCEADGLNALASSRAIAIPEVIALGEAADESFLVLEWIESKRPDHTSSTLLGTQLAGLHRVSAPEFGFDADNYMGSLRQSNKKHPDWAGFFIEERLMPMVETGSYKGLLSQVDRRNFEKLYHNLPGLFTEETPSLIHGDLWSGNYLISSTGQPYLIDPAVSYGNREFDIAMTTLFGGFDAAFYQAYNQAFPLQKGWEQRLNLWNLYPLLLHLNLFGTGYLGQVRSCLQQYI